jgi:hypothetical protein
MTVTVAPGDYSADLNKLGEKLESCALGQNTTDKKPHDVSSSFDVTAAGRGKDPGRFVTVADLDLGSDDMRFVPDTPRNPPLTQQLLTGHNQLGGLSREDRIFQWLAERDKETISQSLPTHLPDIKYTFKFLKSGTLVQQ